MNSIQTYLDLITSEHDEQPDFVATVSFCVAIMVQIQALMYSMMDEGGIFDLSTPPVGNQLDIIGEWVGASRNVNIPIPGVYFSWDEGAGIGWDYGIWQPDNQPTDLVTLPDDVYLTLILAKIAANNWDGTTVGAYAIWDILFPNYSLLIQDNQNMSFIVAIQGMPIDSLTLALLTQGYLPLRPEGVLISEYIVPVDTNPLFAWDTDSPYLNGWDVGSWGIELAPS